ncbi:MAG: hypothetical protein JW809_19960 [Pirellulales bacterium]|nr:hypothetical protein [Pirellulales bacterium]
MSRRDAWVLGLLGVGAVLVAVSYAWPWLRDPQAVWTEEDATRRTEANLRLHGLAHEMGHARDERHKQELTSRIEVARREFDAVNRELADARRRYDRPARWLFWTGWACVAAGVAAWGVFRGRGA